MPLVIWLRFGVRPTIFFSPFFPHGFLSQLNLFLADSPFLPRFFMGGRRAGIYFRGDLSGRTVVTAIPEKDCQL